MTHEKRVQEKVAEYVARKTAELAAMGKAPAEIARLLKDVGETAEERLWRTSKQQR